MIQQCYEVRSSCFYSSFSFVGKYCNRTENTANVMKFMVLLFITGIASLFLLCAVDANVTDCKPRNLTATVDDEMRLYIDGVETTNLTNAYHWENADTVELPCNATVIGIQGTDVHEVGGMVASTDDGYILTNSSWKCTSRTFVDWQTTDFDDSDWPQAFETSPTATHVGWNVPGIRENAVWIWTTAFNYEDKIVYCRKTLASPHVSSLINYLTWTAKPSYGPISGGTNVNLTIAGWSQTNLDVIAVYFGDDLKASIICKERSTDNLVILTPPTNESLIGEPLTIRVKFSPGFIVVNTNETFTYGGNPNITDIVPKRFLVTGGMSMTVIGNYLNSVANPFVQATVNVYRDAEFNSTSMTTYEPCNSAGNGSQMVCVMPRITIPEDFLDALGNSSYINQSIIDPNGNDRVDITIGFLLDGYKKYEDITKAIPGLQLEFYAPPEIRLSEELIRFNPKSNETIPIQGRHMTRGCQMEDYKIQLGNGVCSKTSLTDNVLTCRPPTSEPQKTSKDDLYCDGNLAVIVTIGYKTYHYSCLTYSTSFNVIAFGAGLGGGLLFLLILLIIIIALCVTIRRRKIAKKRPDEINGVGSIFDRKNDWVTLGDKSASPIADDYNTVID